MYLLYPAFDPASHVCLNVIIHTTFLTTYLISKRNITSPLRRALGFTLGIRCMYINILNLRVFAVSLPIVEIIVVKQVGHFSSYQAVALGETINECSIYQPECIVSVTIGGGFKILKITALVIVSCCQPGNYSGWMEKVDPQRSRGEPSSLFYAQAGRQQRFDLQVEKQ